MEVDPCEVDPCEVDPCEVDPCEVDPDDETLDTSWFDNFKEKESNYNNFYKEPITSIKIYLLYINKNKEIIHQDKNNCLLENGSLNRDRIISLIKHYQVRESIHYKLSFLLRYNIDLDPVDIRDFLAEDVTNDRFITSEKYLDDIHYKDTILMFHNLNALYFFFDEVAPPPPTMNHTKRIILVKKHKTMRNKNKKNLKISKEIS